MATGAGKSSGNVYTQSANALQGAGNIYSKPQLTGNASTYNPATASAFGYDANTINAASAANPAAISAGISKYMNPYTSDVINRTSADILRGAKQQTMANNAAAVNAGAFGGGRQGVVDAITNSEAQKNIGDVSANLRNQGWTTAAGLSAQDIANQMATGQFNASLLQQARMGNQDAINAAKQFTASNKQNNSQFNAAAKNTAGQFNAAERNAWEQAQANEALARASGLQGLGTTAFGMGQSIGGQQAQQGSTQQQLIQNIMNLASGQFSDWSGQPTNMLNTLLSSLGMNPLSSTGKTTQQNNPGLFDWISLFGQSATG